LADDGLVAKYVSRLFYLCHSGERKLTTTIKIEDAKKEKLDVFLASLLLKERVKITLQEAAGLMVDYALENKEDIIKRLKEMPPLEEDPAWKGLENPLR